MMLRLLVILVATFIAVVNSTVIVIAQDRETNHTDHSGENYFNTSMSRILQEQHSQRFLLYSPQFGLYNQLRALYHALAVSRVLNRVLVVPEIVSNNGAGPVVPRSMLFDSSLLFLKASGFVISTSEYQNLVRSGMASAPKKIINLPVPIKQLIPTMLYFKFLDLGKTPHDSLPESYKFKFSEKEWLRFEQEDPLGVTNDNTIAFYSLYMAWMDNKYTQLQWLESLERPVYQEAPWITKFVTKVVRTKFDLSNGYICGHVRRGDFKASCSAYDAEIASGTPRPFVRDNYLKGLSCWVSAEVLVAQLRYLKTKLTAELGHMLPIYISTNDLKFAVHSRQALHDEGIKAYFLGDFITPEMESSKDSFPVIDVSLCSHANVLILNQYSTFSSGIYKQAEWLSQDDKSVVAYAWSRSDFTGDKPMYTVGKFK